MGRPRSAGCSRTVLAASFVFIGVALLAILLLAASSWLPEQLLIVAFNAMILLLLVALVGLHRMLGGADGRRGRIGARLIVASVPMFVVTALVVWLIQSLVSSDRSDFILNPAFEILLIGGFVLAITTALIAVAGILLLTIGMALSKVVHSTPLWIFLGGIAMVTLTVSEFFDFGAIALAGTVTSATGLVLLGIIVWRHPAPETAEESAGVSLAAPAIAGTEVA